MPLHFLCISFHMQFCWPAFLKDVEKWVPQKKKLPKKNNKKHKSCTVLKAMSSISVTTDQVTALVRKRLLTENIGNPLKEKRKIKC